MKIKTSELTGAALDWAVARSQGICLHERTEHYTSQDDTGFTCLDCGRDTYGQPSRDTYQPSTDWSQGGPLIEEYCGAMDYESRSCEEPFYAQTRCSDPDAYANGETLLQAAMRAICISRLGHTVDVPSELAP